MSASGICKVLVVSHNAFGDTTNMGKTLKSYFGSFGSERLAQFYIYPEAPSDWSFCRSYYRVTDEEILSSCLPFSRKCCGGVLNPREDVEGECVAQDCDSIEKVAYRQGTKRSSFAYVLRNALWGMGFWKTKRLREWVDSFSPDVVFFASGDYSFMYDIAMYIADYADVPLVVACVDDYYLHNKNRESLLGRFDFASFMQTVNKTMCRSSKIFVICESMKKEYEKLFGKTVEVLHTSVEPAHLELRSDADRISYIGNLGLGRSESLIEIGRALKLLRESGLPECIDVYSADTDERIVSQMIPENGICFHGCVGSDEVLRVMEGSLAVIHVESFNEVIKKRTRFSVSTKIAESLAYGPCLIAYGPRGIASIEYLIESGAAHVVTSPQELVSGLRRVLLDCDYRRGLLEKARATSNANHNASFNSHKLAESLGFVCDAWRCSG